MLCCPVLGAVRPHGEVEWQHCDGLVRRHAGGGAGGLPDATAEALLSVAEARSAGLQQQMSERLLLGLARAVSRCGRVDELGPLQRRVALLDQPRS